MTSDRRNKRTPREFKLNLESLGERIAPAVYHHGLVFLNLVVDNSHTRNNREIKELRLERARLNNPIIVSNPVKFPTYIVRGSSTVATTDSTSVNTPVTTFPTYIVRGSSTVATANSTTDSTSVNTPVTTFPTYIVRGSSTVATADSTTDSTSVNTPVTTFPTYIVR